MLGKIKLFSLFLILDFEIGNVSSICIPGDNCPYYQGVCNMDKCECLPGYKTFITQDTTNIVNCNYKQTSKWVPFLLELFLPSIGLFYLGRYFHAFLKLALFIPLIWSGKESSLFWFFLFFFIYILDLICLFFCFYSDGNGFPLV